MKRLIEGEKEEQEAAYVHNIQRCTLVTDRCLHHRIPVHMKGLGSGRCCYIHDVWSLYHSRMLHHRPK